MNITTEFLKDKNACPEGVKWFDAQEERDGAKVVEKLMSEDKLDWANWLIVRIMERERRIAYAIFAVEQCYRFKILFSR
jgi:hypothetical protein